MEEMPALLAIPRELRTQTAANQCFSCSFQYSLSVNVDNR